MTRHPFQDDIEYAARMYCREQVEPHAEKCENGKCKSYTQCMFGRQRYDGSAPKPLCARLILQEIEKQKKES